MRSRGAMRPEFWKNLALEIRGRREDRMRGAPAVSRAMCIEECCTRAYSFSGEHQAFPAQWLYGLYEFALVTGFLATIVRSKREPLANLTPAPGRRTRTISPYATTAFVFAAITSTAPRPNACDDGLRPLCPPWACVISTFAVRRCEAEFRSSRISARRQRTPGRRQRAASRRIRIRARPQEPTQSWVR